MQCSTTFRVKVRPWLRVSRIRRTSVPSEMIRSTFFRKALSSLKASSFSAASFARTSSSNRFVTMTASEMEKMIASVLCFSADAIRAWICNSRFSVRRCSNWSLTPVRNSLSGWVIEVSSCAPWLITSPICPE